MIQEMRDSLFKGKYSAQVLIFIMIFAIAGVSFTGFIALFKQNKEHSVGHIGSRYILKHDLEIRIDEYHRLVAYFEKQFGSFAKAFLSMQGLQDPTTFVLQRLKSETVLADIYDTASLTISSDYIAQKLHDTNFLFSSLGSFVPPYVIDNLGGINQKALAQHLLRHGITIEMFDGIVSNVLKKDFATKLLRDSFYDPTYDNGNNKCLAAKANKTFVVGRLRFSDYLDRENAAKSPSIEILKQFYAQENQTHKKYWTDEKRRGIVWTFSANMYDRKISDTAITKYYQDHKKEYTLKPERVYIRRIVFASEALAQKIHSEMRNQQNLFADFARKHSIISKEALKGGEFGFIELVADTKTLTPDQKLRQEKASSLYKDGSISDVYKTADGFEIIGRTRKEFATLKPLASVKEAITKEIRQKTFAKIFLQEAREACRKSSEDFEKFVERQQAKQEIITDARLNELSKVGVRKALDNGTIIELVLLEQAKAIPFEQVQSQVLADYHVQNAQKQFEADSKSLRLRIEKTSQLPKESVFGFTTQTLSIQSPLDWQSPVMKLLPIDRMKRMIHPSKIIFTTPSVEGKNEKDSLFIQLTKCTFSDEKVCENVEKSKENSKNALTIDQFMENIIVSFMRNVTMEIDPIILAQLLK